MDRRFRWRVCICRCDSSASHRILIRRRGRFRNRRRSTCVLGSIFHPWGLSLRSRNSRTRGFRTHMSSACVWRRSASDPACACTRGYSSIPHSFHGVLCTRRWNTRVLCSILNLLYGCCHTQLSYRPTLWAGRTRACYSCRRSRTLGDRTRQRRIREHHNIFCP